MKSPQQETSIQLDAIDRRILAALQENGRITNIALSRVAGVSAPPALRRVRALEEAGIIRGYHADIDLRKLGWEITVFAIVGLDSQKEAVLSAFEQLVATWPEVRECHMIRGGGDFLLRFVVRDAEHESQLTQRLSGLPTVSRVQTLQTIRTSRSLRYDEGFEKPPGTYRDHLTAPETPATSGASTGSAPQAGLTKAEDLIAKPPLREPLGDTLTASFSKAVTAAIAKAHAAGLAVPGRENGRAVEFRPDGEIREIDETFEWSPHDWRTRP